MLTDAQIKRLPRPDRDQLMPAGNRDGLYLRVRAATGRKTFVLRRRLNGAWRVETLGDWPKLTLLNARRRASTAPVAIAAAETFEAAAKRFYEDVIEPRYRNAPEETGAYFTRDCSAIAKRRLDRITRADLAAVVRDKARRAPNAAGKLLVLLKQFYRWALIGELIDADPTSGLTAKGLNLPGYTARERTLTDDELRALWSLPDEPYGRLLRFTLLTACRVGESIKLDPSQVVGDVWTIPITKNGKPHILPLTTTASTLAAAGWPPRIYKSLHAYLVARKTAWNPHDLRRSAATRMRDAGAPIEAIEVVLITRARGWSGSISGRT